MDDSSRSVQNGPRQTHQSRIYSDIKQRLQLGEFGSQLPSVRQLAADYSSTSGTIHQVLSKLRHERLLRTRHGLGTFVVAPSEKVRQVLLLSAVEGHLWGDFMHGFSQAFSSCPRTRLLIEAAPGGSVEARQHLEEKVSKIIDEGVDAIVFSGLPDSGMDFLERYHKKVPMISFFDGQLGAGWACGSVTSDWYHGGYAGTKHLIEVGCRHLVIVTHFVERSDWSLASKEFVQGCEAACADSLGAVDFQIFGPSAVGEKEVYLKQFSNFLEKHPQTDGIFGYADYKVAPLIPFLREQGKRVPEDIAVLGYMDTPWTQTTNPPMSSVSVRPSDIADAVRHLVENNQWRTRQVIKPQLVIRGSTQGKQPSE